MLLRLLNALWVLGGFGYSDASGGHSSIRYLFEIKKSGETVTSSYSDYVYPIVVLKPEVQLWRTSATETTYYATATATQTINGVPTPVPYQKEETQQVPAGPWQFK